MSKSIGFNTIKCLQQGNIQHQERANLDVKNLLSTGEIDENYVIEILKRINSNEYKSSPHHYDSKIIVHIVETKFDAIYWYIKWYFDEPNCVFISVHNSVKN